MIKSTISLFLSLLVFSLGCYLVKDAPIVMVGRDPLPDSGWYALVLVGLVGIIGSIVAMKWENEYRQAQIQRRMEAIEDSRHRQENLSRSERQLRCTWSAVTRIPQC